MNLRWIVGGSYNVQAASEPPEPARTREDLLPVVANLEALKAGTEADPVFGIPAHNPDTQQPPAEIRLYAIPVGELLPSPGSDGADVIASPHVYASAVVPADPAGVPELRIEAPTLDADAYIVLIVYGFAD